MGFGHRAFINFDPRAKVMKQTCDEVSWYRHQRSTTCFGYGTGNVALERPEYFVGATFTNVDFYSGIVLKAIGIPAEMFTVIFALARTVGWIGHWLEMHSGPYKIGRPASLYG